MSVNIKQIFLGLFFLCGIETANAAAFSTDEIFSFTRIGHVISSPDGKRFAFTTFNLKSLAGGKKWSYALHVTNNAHDRVIHSDNAISNVIWSSDDKWIGYISKGNQFNSIWIAKADGTDHHKLLELHKDIDAFSWSPDNNTLAFIASDADKAQNLTPLGMVDINTDYHNAQLNIASFTNGRASNIETITPTNFSVSQLSETPGFSWAPNSKSIAFSYQAKPGAAYAFNNKIAIVNVLSKKINTLAYSMEHNSVQPIYSHNGKWIAFQATPSNKLPKTAEELKYYYAKQDLIDRICLFDTTSNHVSCLAKTNNEMPMLVGWTMNDEQVIVADFNKTEGMRFYSLSTQTSNAPVLLSKITGYVAPLSITMSASANIGFTSETTEHAPEAYSYDTTTSKLSQITHLNEHASKTYGKVQIIQWPSKDGAVIEGILITPNNYDSHKKYPVLVDAHGGPAGDWNVRYLGGCEEYDNMFVTTSCYASALNQGFVIFQPNPRGSNGYGSTFRLAPVGDIGGIDYQDVISGVDYLIQKNIADPNHLAMNGWSYGGFMTAWSIGHTNRFKAAVEADGNTDLVSFTGTSDIPLFTTEYLGNKLWENSHLYVDRSPIFYTKNISTPLLIISGGKDLRVPITQGQELYTSLLFQHKKVNMLVLPEQGHVPEEANLIFESINAIHDWLNQAIT